MNNTYSIYKVTNILTGKSYIGKSSCPKTRFKSHLYEARAHKHTHYFHRSIRKYGPENFKLEIIDSCMEEEKSYQLEKYWIKKLNTLSPKGFNSNTGGRGGMSNPCVETRTKMSVAKLDKTTWNKGKILSLRYHFYNSTKDTKMGAKSKRWELTFSCGKVKTIYNLSSFCKENNYKQSNLNKLMMGKLNRYKDIVYVVKL